MDPAGSTLLVKSYVGRHFESYAERHIRLYADTTNMDALDWVRRHLEADGSDLVPEMIKAFAE